MKSIIENQEGCYICGRSGNTEVHHVYFGNNRKHSDDCGLTVELCRECHRGTNGVHGKNGYELNLRLKVQFQRLFEKLHGRERFVQIFGKNYL